MRTTLIAQMGKTISTPPVERHRFISGQTPDGNHILSILVKRTYNIIPGGTCVRAQTDERIYSGDEYYKDPMNSSVKFESDYIPWKNATDVVLNGKAYAPDSSPVREMLVSLSVGEAKKELYIVGDRTCVFRPFTDPAFTEPDPFTEMEIRYERAFGGIDIYSDTSMQLPCPRNHLGKGFVVKNKRRSIDGLELPNIEDPENIIHPGNIVCGDMRNWSGQPSPQSLGWLAKFWQPRASLAGIMPADLALTQKLRDAYAALIPKNQKLLFEQTKLKTMDFAFFNGASPDLSFPYLKGDEEISCVNLTPEGDLTFRLPGKRPEIEIDIGFGGQHPEAVLHTIMIRMEERQIDMLWRSAIDYPGPDWLPHMKKKEISIQ